MKAISVLNLHKTYKTYEREKGFFSALGSLFRRKFKIKEALRGISFDVEEGEILGFIGPNGAGKSTAIKLLCGIIYPDSGKIKVLNYTPWEDRVNYVANIGVVFGQKNQLWWDLPPVDTFYLIKDLYEVPEKEFEEKMNYMIDLLNVRYVFKTPVRDLSLGERMKCELIAALLHNPKIVFLDEPTIGMDIIAKEKVREFIKEINEKYQTTFVITTHDLNDIEKLCKRVIIIIQGSIIYDGLLEKLRKKYIKKKLITVKFQTKTSVKLPVFCKIVHEDSYEVKFETKGSKKAVSEIIKSLIKEYPVVDITVSDPGIEEVIKDVYEK